MSASNPPDLNLGAIMITVSVGFTIFQAWKYDRCRCLLFKRKDWFRALLCWMLLGGNIGLMIWVIGWAYVKYQLGWVIIPGYGALPVPDLMWEEKYRRLNTPLTIMMEAGFGMLISLSAEEGLYWYHLMRAIRHPRLAGSWLNSHFFYSWIGITCVTIGIQLTVAWAHQGSFSEQLSRGFLCGGVIELVVVVVSSIVIFKFPQFLKDVKASGASPRVVARLHFYNEANKLRTFCRLLFCVAVIVPGLDALTVKKRIVSIPIANDILIQVCFISYFLALIISAIVYLPRDWTHRSKFAQADVMVANPRYPNLHRTSTEEDLHGASFALMSLLREGGQWDYEDDAPRTKMPIAQGEINESQVDFSTRAPSTRDMDMEGDIGSSVFGDALIVAPADKRSSMFEDWQGPFSAPVGEKPIPKELKIMVEQEQEVHDDQSGISRGRF